MANKVNEADEDLTVFLQSAYKYPYKKFRIENHKPLMGGSLYYLNVIKEDDSLNLAWAWKDEEGYRLFTYFGTVLDFLSTRDNKKYLWIDKISSRRVTATILTFSLVVILAISVCINGFDKSSSALGGAFAVVLGYYFADDRKSRNQN